MMIVWRIFRNEKDVHVISPGTRSGTNWIVSYFPRHLKWLKL